MLEVSLRGRWYLLFERALVHERCGCDSMMQSFHGLSRSVRTELVAPVQRLPLRAREQEGESDLAPAAKNGR
jgi:hypothetical protein